MNPRSDKTLFERILAWWRGLFAQPPRQNQRSSDQRASGNSSGVGRNGHSAIADAEHTRTGAEAAVASRDTAPGAAQSTAGNSGSADVARQDSAPSASGASDDEFPAGGYSAGHTDRDDIEDAADADGGGTVSDSPGATASFRSMTGGNEPSGDSGWTVGGSTSAAEDSGSAASRGSGLDEPATFESDSPTMPAAGVDRTGPAGVSDFDNAGGADDAGAGDLLHGDDRIDEAESVHQAVGGSAANAGATQRSADEQEAELDRSMQGDTDYVTAGYPSEAIDIDITDADDVGVEDAESNATDEGAQDDAADFSEDAGELGLADSETVDDGVPDAEADESSFTPASPGDVGVGASAEVDDTSVIATSDNATLAESDDVGNGEGDEDGGGDVIVAGAGTTARTAAGGGDSNGGVRGDGSTNTPEGYPVKGNASSKIYHLPGTASYEGTKAEWCFATEEDAIAAGYRAPAGRNRGHAGGTSGAGESGDAGAPEQGVTASEGMQSYASSANRDALADMQETLADEANTRVEPPAPELGGLGSDPSAADDPTSVGLPAAESPSTGVTGDVRVDDAFGADAEAASITAAAVGETTDPAQAPAADVSSMQTDTIEQASTDSGLPVEADEPEGVGAASSGDAQSYAGAVPGDGSKSCPVGYPIKGNADSMIYHTPGRASYDNTIPEWCFATEEDAVNAGFRAPKR